MARKIEIGLALWQKMLIGIAAGIAVGLVLSPHAIGLFNEEVTATLASWIALPGAIFMALIKMIVIPLVVCSITLAIANNKDISYLRKTGGRVALYFVGTTIIAVSIGYILGTIINPGSYVNADLMVASKEAFMNGLPVVETRPSLPEMLVGLLPTNPAKAVVNHSMMQIVIASIFVGIALLTMEKKLAKPVIDLCNSVLELSMVVVRWAMYIAPVAVFGFLCNLTIQLGLDTLVAMSVYMGTVLLGLLSLLAFYLFLISTVGKRNPLDFLRDIRNAQLLAFSSSSSSATMPVTLQVAEDKLKINPQISKFVIPLGTTINMDGTALYQIIAAIFLTQVFGIDLSFIETMILAVTIIGASIGSPGSPGVGLVILSTILYNIGVSPEGIAMILGVDRILDMCRTTVNVTGDLTASVVMEKWVKK